MLDYFAEENVTGDVWIMDKNSPYDLLIAHRSTIDIPALERFLEHIKEQSDDA